MTAQEFDRLPLMLSAAQVASLMGIGRNQVYERAHQGVIPCLRMGRRVLFLREELRTFFGLRPAAPAAVPSPERHVSRRRKRRPRPTRTGR